MYAPNFDAMTDEDLSQWLDAEKDLPLTLGVFVLYARVRLAYLRATARGTRSLAAQHARQLSTLRSSVHAAKR